jgi:hypothetical protein
MWILIALLIGLLCFYIPGASIMSVLKLRDNKQKYLIFSTILGLALFLIANYTLSYARLPMLVAILLSISWAWYVLTKQWKPDFYYIKNNYIIISIALIIINTILFVLLNSSSGLITQQGYELRGTNARDGILHLALSKTMTHTFPPQRPGFADVTLQGYHYFYPFMVGKLSAIFNLPVEDLLFRHMPLIGSLIFGSSFYLIASILTQSQTSRNLIVTLAYMGYGTIPLLKPLDFPGMQYAVTLIHNPSTIYAIPLLLAGWFAWLKIKDNNMWVIATILCIGVLAQLKVYASIIAIISLTVTFTIIAIKELVNKKSIKYSKKYAITLLGIATLTFFTFYIHNTGSATLVWAPMRYIDHFMEQSSLSDWQWSNKKEIFESDNNYPRIIILHLQALFLFFFYHIGNRVFIIALIPKLIAKSFWQKESNIILISAFTAMILIPLLTIQSIAVFDIGQFFWIASALSAIPAGLSASILWRYKIARPVIVLVILVPFLLGYWKDFKTHQILPATVVIPISEYEVFKEVTNKTHLSSKILFIPDGKENSENEIYNLPIISAMTGRLVYYEKELTPFKSKGEDTNREETILALTQATQQCDTSIFNQLINQTQINNIVFTGILCDQIKQQFTHSKETKTISFYQIQ